MSTTRVLRDEIYEYPDTGDINYGEEASGWVGSATSILGEVSGPGDIPTTEKTLLETAGAYSIGPIDKLSFDTSFVQSISITGFITRKFTIASGIAQRVESFVVEGAYNATVINYSTEFSGDDTDFEFTVTGGQFGYNYLNITDTESVTIKFSAKVKIDASALP